MAYIAVRVVVCDAIRTLEIVCIVYTVLKKNNVVLLPCIFTNLHVATKIRLIEINIALCNSKQF